MAIARIAGQIRLRHWEFAAGQRQAIRPFSFYSDRHPIPSMKNILFVCGKNRQRSPTAEQIFASDQRFEVASAGISADADNPLTHDLVEWADIIFVMEKSHRQKLATHFRTSLKNSRVICLDIPDKYAFMAPELIQILKSKIAAHLR